MTLFYFSLFLNNALLRNVMTLDAAEDSQLLFQCPATLIMDNIIDLHHDMFSIMLIMGSIVFYLICAIIWKFSAGNSATKSNFDFTHHTVLEIVWTLIPMLILLLILVPSFVLLYSMDEMHDSQVTMKIIGSQWYWSYEFPLDEVKQCSFGGQLTGLEGWYEYSSKIITFDSYLLPDSDLPFGGFRLLEVDNRVKLPVEMHTRVLMTATDVLHSWAVPSFGIKMDACPGRLNQFGLLIYRLGVFYGQCSEICGMNHGFMPIVVEGVTVNEYVSWLKKFHQPIIMLLEDDLSFTDGIFKFK